MLHSTSFKGEQTTMQANQHTTSLPTLPPPAAMKLHPAASTTVFHTSCTSVTVTNRQPQNFSLEKSGNNAYQQALETYPSHQNHQIWASAHSCTTGLAHCKAASNCHQPHDWLLHTPAQPLTLASKHSAGLINFQPQSNCYQHQHHDDQAADSSCSSSI
jgi:hypothetical protein